MISRIDSSGNQSLWVVFEGGTHSRLYPLNTLTHILEHAFAITVHKSQGSEFDTVALSLPQVHGSQVSQPLVYTAITRAKREVLIMGRSEVLIAAASSPLERFTTLAQRLDMYRDSPSGRETVHG